MISKNIYFLDARRFSLMLQPHDERYSEACPSILSDVRLKFRGRLYVLHIWLLLFISTFNETRIFND